MADLPEKLEISIQIKDLDAMHGLLGALGGWMDGLDGREADLTDSERALVEAIQVFAGGEGQGVGQSPQPGP